MADSGPSRSDAPHRAAPKLDVEIVRNAAVWDRIPIGEALLSRAAHAAFAASLLFDRDHYEAALVLSDDATIKQLNARWRGKDAPTNVLSFPADDFVSDPRPLGDVVLAGETILREAAEQGIAASDHAVHLVVHGVLHLLGFDHLDDDEARKMEALETSVLASLGIADPYADERGEPQSAGVSA